MLHYFEVVTNSILVLATSFILLGLRSLCYAYRSYPISICLEEDNLTLKAQLRVVWNKF